MEHECDFKCEHADGSFMDHLYFCVDYCRLHYSKQSPRVRGLATAKEISHCVQTFHLAVLAPQVAVERTKTEATSHLGCVLLRDREECAPRAALGVGWELLHGCCF